MGNKMADTVEVRFKDDSDRRASSGEVSGRPPSIASSTPSREETLVAAGIGQRPDDPEMPCLTIRMWVIGIAFCLIGSGVNTLFTFRFPAVTLSQSAIQLLSYPVGRVWHMAVPDWGITVLGERYSLNPGPFNYKENILIYILANLSFLTRLSADVLTEQRVFYGLNLGWGFEITITLATLLFGFALAGLSRSIIVEPPRLMWPGVLGNTALNSALHPVEKTYKSEVPVPTDISNRARYRFFLMAFAVSFIWYWFPDFIFPALGYFTWVCWIAPKNAVVNQIFGMKSGIGLLPFTFDWAQIAYIGSPLVIPTWAILNIAASLVFWIYIVTPAIYYSNTWFTAYLPMQTNSIYDNLGKVYNVTRVIDKKDGFVLDLAKYDKYSPIYLPVTYALNTFGLCFASIAALIVWLILEKRQEIYEGFCNSSLAVTLGLAPKTEKTVREQAYGTVPTWWYLVATAVSIGVGIFACEYYPVQLHWYGVLLAMLISAFFFIPIPPRKLFTVQIVGIIMGTLGQVAVLEWALNHIPDICTNKAENGFTCPFSRTHFNTSMVWGAIGPRRFFANGALYRNLLWFFLLGALLPPVVYVLKNYAFPKTKWLKQIHIPLFLGGLNFIPPASGTNYGSWAIVGLIFGLLIKQRKRLWWKQYNFILSSAMDCSVAIAGILIFFSIFYTGASSHFKWWGTEVHKNTCDWKGCTYKVLAKGEKIH
ncbi:Glutathione transporter 1 [Beauveria bassiana]|nr:Glutathione transporter 1 [Beauveria bassiana]